MSVLGAVVAWRASIYSSDASDLDQRATQELVRREQIVASSRGAVAQDRRFHGPYQEHVKAAVLLERDARALRATDAVKSAELRAEALDERALARSLAQFFYSPTPGYPTSSGNVGYDARAALQYIEETDAELPILHPGAVAKDAQTLHDRTVHLVAVAAIFVLALFLLTLAELARPATRAAFAAGGVAAMAAGVVLFLVIGP